MKRIVWLAIVLTWFWPLVLCCALSAGFGAFAMWLWCLAQVAPVGMNSGTPALGILGAGQAQGRLGDERQPAA